MKNVQHKIFNQCQLVKVQMHLVKFLTLLRQWISLVCCLGILFSSTAVAQMQPTPASPPIANPFAASVNENSSNNVIPSQTAGFPDSIQITSPATHGELTISGFNFIYTPHANYTGTDTFFYTASNISGVSLPARVSITINALPPIAK